MSWCKAIFLPFLLKRIKQIYLCRNKSLINGGATCPWLELKEPSVSLQSCTSQTKSTHTTYVITSTFLIENICHDSLPQERRKLHHQLAMRQEPLPPLFCKQCVQTAFFPSSSSANPAASFMPPNPLQTHFCQDVQPGISLLNSTVNCNCTVELHTHSCVLPFKSQFRKWSCSLDDVFLCQCLVACHFFPSPTSEWLWQKPIDGNAPGIPRQTP